MSNWKCPECGLNNLPFGGGCCPCSDHKDHQVSLVEVEEKMANIIKYAGNVERFRGQKKAFLLIAESKIVKNLSQFFIDEVGADIIPRGTCIAMCFLGDKGLPFLDVASYGSARLCRLQKSYGAEFEIDFPYKDATQINLEMVS